MKRALVVCTVLAVLGFSAFGIGTFSGKWEAMVDLLPSAGLASHKLTVNYTDFGWTFTGILSGAPFSTFQFKAVGAFGPFSLTGNMYFDFSPADYNKADLTTSLDFAGLGISLKVEHWSADETGTPCTYHTGDVGYLRYTLTTTVDPITLKIVMLDCCTGTAFNSALITIKNIGLCCGISLNSEFSFTKAGFDYVKFTGINIPLCCGVSLTAGVTFYTDEKALDVGFDFAGFADACFKVYADAITEGSAWLGIEVYGWKIRCSLGDCNYIEFLTAIDVDYVDEIEAVEGDILQGDEFEYIKLGFCGAGCCGGKYTVDLAVYFDNGGGLFGISRLGANMSIPIMSNFTVKVSFATPDNLSVGWVFTF
jgi:hypothetical protein